MGKVDWSGRTINKQNEAVGHHTSHKIHLIAVIPKVYSKNYSEKILLSSQTCSVVPAEHGLFHKF